jgi:hypothetical protein
MADRFNKCNFNEAAMKFTVVCLVLIGKFKLFCCIISSLITLKCHTQFFHCICDNFKTRIICFQYQSIYLF